MLFFLSFYLFSFLATPAACGSSQARDRTHATAVTWAAAVPDPQSTAPQKETQNVYFQSKAKQNKTKHTLLRNFKNWDSCALLGKWKLVQLPRKSVWKFLKKLKIELPHDLVILLLDIYPKELKSRSLRKICTSMFIAALFTIAKLWKNLKVHWQMNKDNAVYTHECNIPQL